VARARLADLGRPLTRTSTVGKVLGLLLAVSLFVGCSAWNSESETTEGRLAAGGVVVDPPHGWEGRIFKRTNEVPGAVVLHVASFPLPRLADDWASAAERGLEDGEALIVVSETLPGMNLPPEPARVEPGERRATIDRYFISGGRGFMLHVAFGSRPPSAELIRNVNAILATLSIERRTEPLRPAPDPAPAAALAPAPLLPTPKRVIGRCRAAQSRASFPILCPALLPRPFLGPPRGVTADPLPDWTASWRSRSDPAYRKRRFGGVTIGYGAPWEPDSGPDWRLHLWRNRPCCFLHFEVFRRGEGRRHVPAGAFPMVLGGRQGLLKDATSYGLSSRGDYLYFPNHTRFLWRENGVLYVATLHRFGTRQETRDLLGRLIHELRPVSEL
jgi:hypothetical protein